MRMFIGSDVHGSEANLIRFFTRVDASLADDKDTKVILLGDIYNHGPRTYVYVLTAEAPQQFERKSVSTGLSDGVRIEIKSGLALADSVKLRSTIVQ